MRTFLMGLLLAALLVLPGGSGRGKPPEGGAPKGVPEDVPVRFRC